MDDISEYEIVELSEFFKVLGDPTRLRILYALEPGAKCVNCICEELDMTMSAISHQLKILKGWNLVKSNRSGKNVIYSLSDDHVHDIILKTGEHLME